MCCNLGLGGVFQANDGVQGFLLYERLGPGHMFFNLALACLPRPDLIGMSTNNHERRVPRLPRHCIEMDIGFRRSLRCCCVVGCSVGVVLGKVLV